jgi:hypothetical protein
MGQSEIAHIGELRAGSIHYQMVPRIRLSGIVTADSTETARMQQRIKVCDFPH